MPPPKVKLALDFKIIHIDEISKLYPRPEYIFCLDEIDSRFSIKNISNAKIISIYGRGNEQTYNFFMDNLMNLQEVYSTLNDETSRRTFCGYWLGNICHKFDEFVFENTTQYLSAGFTPKIGSFVIDCGVCDGYTSAKFAKMGCKVYGFEMDKINFEIAKKLAAEKGFVVENLGLGSYNRKMKYTHVEGNIGASKLSSDGNEMAQIVTLDSYVRENKLPSVDFIKMDVEGAELDVLRGAADTIARFKPILALSAYHKWDDFWTLTNFVKSIRPDYKFALRHYVTTPEDISFDDGLKNRLIGLNLASNLQSGFECVLLAK